MERSLIRDGMYELMSELQYQYWAAKPKNGGLVAAQASAKWQQLFDAPGAVTDLLGENPAYAARSSGFEPPPSLLDLTLPCFAQASPGQFCPSRDSRNALTRITHRPVYK